MFVWFANVRVEHRGEFVEYNDRINVEPIDGRPVTEKDVVQYAMGLILNSRPDMKGGRVIVARATLLR
ncbi:hypothetical protein ACIBEA_29895 [Streptomyces sp. NPDC051555]|uniref:hypothetical protein n=1 Tax=Streptomyces sp. NPDC051555 TaxID=3365657 RepID=UPI00379EE1A8